MIDQWTLGGIVETDAVAVVSCNSSLTLLLQYRAEFVYIIGVLLQPIYVSKELKHLAQWLSKCHLLVARCTTVLFRRLFVIEIEIDTV